MSENDAAAKTYFDSEEVAEHVRHSAHEESLKGFDHDGFSGLPIRKDVLHYVRFRLFRAETGLITAGGLPLPEVLMEGDGTLKVIFSVEARNVCLWVPCHGVVVLERYSEAAGDFLQFVLRSEGAPDEFDDEVERAFEWMEGDHA